MSALPVVQAAELAAAEPENLWMIDTLWLRRAVGVIGGPPKTNKTYLALDIALSVASSTPALGGFAVRDPGPVLIYMAEDAEGAIKERLLALCHHRGLDLHRIPLYVITASTLRLDLPTDQRRLLDAVVAYRPTLLVLDPLVRLHALNENDAGEISRLLGYLRELQRSRQCSLLLVHHTRKNGAGSGGGQSLRGSGDIHAWVDSSLYLARRARQITLTAEHRSAPSPEPISLALVGSDDEQDRNAHLEIVDAPNPADAEQKQIEDKLIAELHTAPRSRPQLRQALALRNERLGHLLEHLAAQGRIVYADHLWRVPFP